MSTENKPEILRISLSKWIRGSVEDPDVGHGESKLLRDDGHMCCLGFYCKQNLGIKKKNLLEVISPGEILERIKGTSGEWLCDYGYLDHDYEYKFPKIADSKKGKDLMTINDDPEIPDWERRARVQAHFGLQGIIVEFVP